MAEVLSDEFILSESEIENLFIDDAQEETTQEPSPVNKEGEEEIKTTEEEDVNPDDLFTEPESVGSEENKEHQEKEDTPDDKDGTSPNSNFYSSIAKALADESIFPDLDDETLESIKTPEDFAEAVEKQIQAKLDERQRRIDAVLNADVEPDEVRRFEQTLNYLDSIQEESLKDESDKGETLRKQLIFQDFINRGYSKERATREVKKSFDAGTDIEDAKEALESNKEFFNERYDDLVKDAQEQAKAEQERLKKEANDLKKSLLEDKEVFAGIQLDKATRQKAYDAVTKPIAKDEDGEYLTAVQKYEKDNPVEFRKKLGVLFTMTDGFKDIDKLVKGKVRKEVKSSMRELEHKLRNTTRPSGNPRYVGGIEEDPETYIGGKWLVDA